MSGFQEVILLILGLSFVEKSYCQEGCEEPLGLENGSIPDSHITASSAFENDFSTYGGHQARLRKTTWPQGYRSAKKSGPWLKVELNKSFIITGIATQGYGDHTVNEWMTEFYLFYADANGQQFKAVSKSSNETFLANKDRDRVKLNYLAFPVVTKTILLIAKDSYNNVAFRMELYGCEPGYHFVVWLMVQNKTFRHQYMYSYTEAHKDMKEKVLYKVNRHLERVPGYITTRLIRFSPKPFKEVSPFLVAELEIYCIERDREKMIYGIKKLLGQDKFFEPSYFRLNHPLDKNCLPPSIDIGLHKNPFEIEEVVTRPIIFIEPKIKNRCNDKDRQPSVGCSGSGINANEGLYKYFNHFLIPRNQNKTIFRVFSRSLSELRGRSEFAYIMCRTTLVVNKKTYGQSYDYGFIQLTKNKIVAKLRGQDFIVRGMKYLHFDASESYHTLMPWNGYHEMNFTWTLIESRENNQVYPALLGEGVKVKFNVMDLNAATYKVALVVSTKKQTTTVEKQVQIIDNPKVYIRCKRNCGPRLKGNTSRVFQMFCEGKACNKSQVFEWQLLYDNKSVNSICNGQIHQGSNFTLVLFGFTCPGQGTLEIKGIIYVNNNYMTLPVGARFSLMIANTSRICSVSSSSGRVLETTFNINCVGWADGGLFPVYNLFLMSDAGPVDLLLNQPSVMRTILPVGDPKRHHSLHLNVNISYPNGEEGCVSLDVKVSPITPSAVLEMFRPGSNLTAMFLSLVKNGEINKASTIAIAALSVFKGPSDNITEFENISLSLMAYKVKTDVLNTYKNVSINHVDEVSKFLYVIALCSEQSYAASEDGYDPQENQMNALDILETTTDFVSAKLESVAAKTVKRISKIAFTGLGSIIKSATSDAKSKQETSWFHLDKEVMASQQEKKMNAKKIIQKSIKIVKKVGQLASNTLMAGEQSTLDIPHMAMLVLKGNKTTFSRRVIHFHDSIVRFPSDEVLFGGRTINRLDLFDLQIILWRINPLVWHYSSDSIKSAVIEITFSRSQFINITHEQYPDRNTHNRSGDNETDCKPHPNNHKTRCNNTVWRQKNKTESIIEENTTPEELKFFNLSIPIEILIPKYTDELQNSTKEKAENDEEVFFVKPSTEDTDYLTYHQMNVTSPFVSTSVKVKPKADVKLDLYIRYNEKPTSKDFNFTKQIPDFSSCFYDLQSKEYVNCSTEPYTFSFTAKDSVYTGIHYLGIRYLPSFYNGTKNHTTPASSEHLVIRVRRSDQEPCSGNGRRQKRSCAEYKKLPPKTAPTYIKKVVPDFENLIDVNYTLDITSGTCMFWDVEDQQWSREGCQLGYNSTRNGVHCLCNHLTAFGGDFFVAPHPIDFSKVFKGFQSLDKSRNIGILITICVLLMLFLIGLLITRRYDRIDVKKNINRTIEMQGIENESPYTYKIQIETGIWRGSGTTADVGIVIYGENGRTAPICITTSRDDDAILFARGSINTFHLLLNKSLGTLIKIKIWHDNAGSSPSWYAHQVIITDEETNEKKHFFINRWLAVDRGDGRIGTAAKPYSKSDGNGFRDFFTLRTARGFANDHLWVSIFTRPPHNSFTRSQRLACSFSILFAAMIVNAMFYQLGSKVGGDKFNIGPIQIQLDAIKIGVQSAFISIPINVIIVMLFKKASNMDSENKTNVSKLMVTLAWVLCCSVILVSASFILFYSMQWGTETSNNWLASILVSSFQDVFITSPIKVVCIALLLSAILKKPPKEDDIRYQKKASKIVNPITTEHPEDEEVLARTRLHEQQKEEMFTVIRQLLRLILLFILFMIVCYGNRDRSRFMFTNAVQDVFRRFDKVHHHKQFWNWSRVVLVPGLFDTRWYNNQPFKYEGGFISNRETFLVGMPRLRQLRVKPVKNCPAYYQYPIVADIFDHCIPSYSLRHEDRGPYYMKGWKRISNVSLYKTKAELDVICPKHWQYHRDDSQKISYMMEMSYASGGYIAELGYNSDFALKTIQDLMDHEWLDEFTSAVFVEFTLFEPSSSLLCVVNYVYKRYLHGQAATARYIKTLVIYPPSDARYKIFMYTSKVALLIYIIVLIIFEARQVYLQRWRYFKSIWNWFEMFLLLLCVMAMIMTSFVQYYASNFIQDVAKNPYKTWATDDLVFYSDLEMLLFGLILFILTIKTLKIVSFNRPVLLMLLSLRSASGPLTSFSMVFFTAIAAFAMLAHLAFGTDTLAYSSLQNAFLEILQVGSFGGDLGFTKLYEISPILGPFYIFFLRFIITLVLVNVFIAILNFSYALSSSEMKSNKPFKNLVIFDFATVYFQALFFADIKKILVDLWKAILQRLTATHVGRKRRLKICKKEKHRRWNKTEESYVCGRCLSSDRESKVSLESIYSEKHNQVETRRNKFPPNIEGIRNCFPECITGCCERRKSKLEVEKELVFTQDQGTGSPNYREELPPSLDSKSFQAENPLNKHFSSEHSILVYNRADTSGGSRDEEGKEEGSLMSIHSQCQSSYDSCDDIEFLDEDYFIADIKKSMSDIRSSIAESWQSLTSNRPSRPQSMHLPQMNPNQIGSSSSPSSLLYSASPSRSETSLPRSRRSIETQSLDEADSDWSFSSGYYRIEGANEYKGR